MTHKITMFEPLEDRILVRVDEPETQIGKIIIPETFRRQPQVGTVMATSGGIRNHDGDLVPPLVKPNDKILFGKYSGTVVEIDGQEFTILKEGDILGILTEKEIENDS